MAHASLPVHASSSLPAHAKTMRSVSCPFLNMADSMHTTACACADSERPSPRFVPASSLQAWLVLVAEGESVGVASPSCCRLLNEALAGERSPSGVSDPPLELPHSASTLRSNST